MLRTVEILDLVQRQGGLAAARASRYALRMHQPIIRWRGGGRDRRRPSRDALLHRKGEPA